MRETYLATAEDQKGTGQNSEEEKQREIHRGEVMLKKKQWVCKGDKTIMGSRVVRVKRDGERNIECEIDRLIDRKRVRKGGGIERGSCVRREVSEHGGGGGGLGGRPCHWEPLCRCCNVQRSQSAMITNSLTMAGEPLHGAVRWLGHRYNKMGYCVLRGLWGGRALEV